MPQPKQKVAFFDKGKGYVGSVVQSKGRRICLQLKDGQKIWLDRRRLRVYKE